MILEVDLVVEAKAFCVRIKPLMTTSNIGVNICGEG